MRHASAAGRGVCRYALARRQGTRRRPNGQRYRPARPKRTDSGNRPDARRHPDHSNDSPACGRNAQSREIAAIYEMTSHNFIQMLNAAWRRTDSMLCVGLDPEPARFPPPLTGRADTILEFCRAIVDATAPYACAFKPQIAYFSAYRAEAQLEKLIAYIHTQYPGVPVILDAKRGDIGSTAALHAREACVR